MDLPQLQKEYEKYFGIMSIENGKIKFPTKFKIELLLKEMEIKRKKKREELKAWQNKMWELKMKKIEGKITKFFSKYYWMHLKNMTNSKYRELWEYLGLDINRLNDPKWNKILIQFITDRTYRYKLREAYLEKDVEFGKNLGDENLKQMINTQIEKTKEELKEMEKKISILKEVLSKVQ